nr:phage integrase N-terminal SAM-like domain-containing protein [Nocardia cyriacigeorgica]
MGTVSLDDIRELRDDFATELRRKNRAKKTIDVYLVHIGYFADYLISEGLPTDAPEITRDHIGGYIETLLTRTNRRTGEPLSPQYARSQYRSLQQFFKYLAAEEIIESDPFDRLSLPDAPDKLVPVPSLESLRALLDQCAGTDFDSRRDNAIVRLFADTGCRCGEIANLDLDDLDFEEDSALVEGWPTAVGAVRRQDPHRAAAVPAHPQPASLCEEKQPAMARSPRAYDRPRHSADAGTPCGGRRHRAHPPAHAAPLVCAQLARERRSGAGSDDACWLAFLADARPLWKVGSR